MQMLGPNIVIKKLYVTMVNIYFILTSDRLTDALNQQCLIKVQGRELRRRVPVKAQKLEPQRAPKVEHPKVPKATLLSPQTLKLWPRRSQKKRPWLLVLVSNSPTPIYSLVLLFWQAISLRENTDLHRSDSQNDHFWDQSRLLS